LVKNKNLRAWRARHFASETAEEKRIRLDKKNESRKRNIDLETPEKKTC